MSGYFYALLVTSVCGAVCGILAWGGFEKYIKYIASLICVLVMLSPFREIDISGIMNSASEIYPEESIGDGLLYKTASEMTEDRAEEYINQIVFNKFGINPISTHIKIDWEQEEPVIEDITVCLASGDFAVASETEEYLRSVLGGKVNVIEG